MLKSISTEGLFRVKKQNKRKIPVLISLLAFALVGVLTLSPIRVYAALNDIEIFNVNSSSLGKRVHLYMNYQSDIPASSNLDNGTTPMYNLYEVPFNFSISRTLSDNSVDTNWLTYYLSGYVYEEIAITFDKNITPEIISISSDDHASIYIEQSSYSNKVLYLKVFFEFNNFYVQRINDFGSFTIQARYLTSALNDTISVTQVNVNHNVEIKQLQISRQPTSHDVVVAEVIRAIQDAEDIDSIISLLNAIKLDADLNAQVLAELQSIGSDVEAIKDYLISGNAGNTVESAVASQSAALSDYLGQEHSLVADAPAGPPQAIALGTTIDNFTQNIEASLYFWSYELRDFFDRIGMIWVLLIVGLVIGLTAFLLRLRK